MMEEHGVTGAGSDLTPASLGDLWRHPIAVAGPDKVVHGILVSFGPGYFQIFGRVKRALVKSFDFKDNFCIVKKGPLFHLF